MSPGGALCRPGLPLLPPLLHFFVHPKDLIAAVALGVVQHSVRHLEPGVVGAVCLGDHCNAADADGYPRGNLRTVGNLEKLHLAADGFQVLKGLVRTLPHHKGHKLFPAVAGKKVSAPP